jgi:leucyl-tRNA synthetase
MSKSKGNVIDPDDLIKSLGADTARLFSLFAAPPEKDLDWNDRGVEGASRFLNRVWRFVMSHLEELRGRQGRVSVGGGSWPLPELSEPGRAFRRTVHETVARVTDDLEHDFHFNTAISAIMELVNALHAFEASSSTAVSGIPPEERRALLGEAVDTALLLLGPFSPHITEELWSLLGHGTSVFAHPWPVADAVALVKQEVMVVVQVDGKIRGRLVLEMNAREDLVRERALADDKVRPWLTGRQVERVVLVPNRLVNVVTRG